MNDTVKAFLERNNINPDEINESINCNIISTREINPIFERYGMYSRKEKRRVSIADIYGYDYEWREVSSNIFESLNDYFDETGDSYHSRSCDDLYKTVEEMLASDSFVSEPIILSNLDKELGIHVVTTNGLHRYSVLRTLYLSEVYKNSEREKEIKDKYTIEAEVADIDKVKTYCNFIISRTRADVMLTNDYDTNGNLTGNIVLVNDEGKQVLSDEELIKFAKPLVARNFELFDSYSYISDFKKFIDETIYSMDSMEDDYGK